MLSHRSNVNVIAKNYIYYIKRERKLSISLLVTKNIKQTGYG